MCVCVCVVCVCVRACVCMLRKKRPLLQREKRPTTAWKTDRQKQKHTSAQLFASILGLFCSYTRSPLRTSAELHANALTMRGGVLMGGVLMGGVLKGGVLMGGLLMGGVLKGGMLMGGVLKGGVLRGGVLRRGVLRRGVPVAAGLREVSFQVKET